MKNVWLLYKIIVFPTLVLGMLRVVSLLSMFGGQKPAQMWKVGNEKNI